MWSGGTHLISREQFAVLQMHILKGIPLQKGHGDLIDRSKLDVTPIDITDLPIDRCLLVYMAEDVDEEPALVSADKESEGKK